MIFFILAPLIFNLNHSMVKILIFFVKFFPVLYCNCFVYYPESLKSTLKGYYAKINELEGLKFDLEYEVRKKDFEVRFEWASPRLFLRENSSACFSFFSRPRRSVSFNGMFFENGYNMFSENARMIVSLVGLLFFFVFDAAVEILIF